MGHDVWFIDLQFRSQRSLLKTHLSFIKKGIKKYILRRKNIYSIISNTGIRHTELNHIITWQHTRPFVDKYLCPKISPVYSSDELIYLVDKLSFDVFIAGSDQIWRPKFMRKFLKTLYFDFLKDRKEKRISYAASFGTDDWEYSPELTKECAELIKEFDAVSVREESGIALCEKYFNVKSQWVLDPTMLLYKEDYINLIENAKTKQSTGNIFCYILDKTDKKQNIIDSVSKQSALTPFYMEKTDSVESVESWLQGFCDAKFVITDSFHGMVFSIIFNIPFLCFVNEWRGKARFISLAKQFGLANRLLFEKDLNKNGFSPINWLETNTILETKRDESLLFLKNNLI
jgi:hypothetical protein